MDSLRNVRPMIIVFTLLGVVLAILVPLLVGLSMFDDRTSSVLTRILELTLFVSYVAFAVLIMPLWPTVGYRLRSSLLILAAAELVVVLYLWRPTSIGPVSWLSASVDLVLSAFFVYTVILVQWSGRKRLPNTIDLAFPLRNGRYCIAQGGPPPVNPHAVVEEQRYALDIVALNKKMQSATSWFPRALNQYSIFGVEVYSPCAGTVVEVLATDPDNPPGVMDARNPAGNHVVIQTNNNLIMLAHLRQNSVIVSHGANVSAGDLIGYAGNSGNSSEPHLHVHASRNGDGIPMSFGTKTLVRNDIIVL